MWRDSRPMGGGPSAGAQSEWTVSEPAAFDEGQGKTVFEGAISIDRKGVVRTFIHWLQPNIKTDGIRYRRVSLVLERMLEQEVLDLRQTFAAVSEAFGVPEQKVIASVRDFFIDAWFLAPDEVMNALVGKNIHMPQELAPPKLEEFLFGAWERMKKQGAKKQGNSGPPWGGDGLVEEDR
ncbi:MAG: hypothetical protein GXX99_05290 [Clostridiales bacterium]|nr:hypothetical protein [Clostridiales bacterium]